MSGQFGDAEMTRPGAVQVRVKVIRFRLEVNSGAQRSGKSILGEVANE
jgi:hypothetical protein